MSEALALLTVPQAVEAAAALRARIDTALDARRAITGTSTAAIVSIAVLVGQLDAIAQAAAVFSINNRDHAAWERLQELLLSTGHLPLPETSPAQETTHGQG